MLVNFSILIVALSLNHLSVPRVAAAQSAKQSVASTHGQGPIAASASRPSVQPSFSRAFASTASPGLLNSFKGSTENNMTDQLASQLTSARLREVRDFWFEHLENEDALIVAGQSAFKRWYAGGEELDNICVDRFAPTLEAIHASGAKTGADLLQAVQPSDPSEWLGLVILLDQITRNCYRGKASSIVFGFFDPMARDVALTAIERGIPDREPEIRWQFAYRSWFYLPLMHSEEATAHEKATEGYARAVEDLKTLADADGDGDAGADGDKYRAKALRVVRENKEAGIAMVQSSVDFERRHFDIIKRFGRYPHRNDALGRETTEEERAYLAGGGETFGSSS